MPEAPCTSASGKVRELYALGDEPAAARRLRPDLDLRRRPADADPRQGAGAHRAVGVLVRAHARTSSRITCWRSGPTGARSSAAGSRCCRSRSSCAATSPARAWRDYLATARSCGHGSPAGLRESERLPEPIVTPATKATSGHDLNITEAEAAALCGERALRGRPRRRARALRAAAPRTPSSAGSSSPTRSSSSASTRDGVVDARRRGADARLLPLLAGRRVRARRRRSRRSTSSSSATGACETGWDNTARARSCPPTSSPGRAARTSRRSSG